jgi:hypothetical protein
MNEFSSVTLHEQAVNARLKALSTPDIRNCSNNPEIQEEMYGAILKVMHVARTTQRIAWGWQSQKSNRNISWVISSHFNPVLEKLTDANGNSVSRIHAVRFDESSNIDQIKAVTNFLRKYNFADYSEMDAIYWLTETLEILTLVIPSGGKAKPVRADGLYCIFCYRDHLEGHETCGAHTSFNRMQGKRFFSRFVEIKKAIREYEQVNGTKFYAFAVNYLHEKGMPSWKQMLDDRSKVIWVVKLLVLLDATHVTNDQQVLNKMAQKLLGPSDFPEQYWPSRMNGLMYRFQAYELCQRDRPDKLVAKRLEMIWENQSIDVVADKTRSTPFNIKRSLEHWHKVIESYRNEGIPDELIKVTTGLKRLPPPRGEPPTTKRPSVLSAPTRGG